MTLKKGWIKTESRTMDGAGGCSRLGDVHK